MEKTEAIEILDYMFEFLFTSAQEGFETEIDDNTVKQYLTDAGFESSQVDNALKYLQSISGEEASEIIHNVNSGITETTGATEVTKTAGTGLRIYSKQEKEQLGITAIGVLTYLDNRGSLSPLLRETIIEQVMELPYQCELDELLWIIESTALNLDNQSQSGVLASGGYESDKEGTRH